MNTKEKVYIIQHQHILNDQEEIKFIGAYSSEDAAKEAIRRLRVQPGFRDYPKLIKPGIDKEHEGFYIDAYELDKDHWAEGFIIV
jgi:homoserine kinase type II